jgi:hypothetical protein
VVGRATVLQAQLAMEKHPDFVVVKADIKNFYAAVGSARAD